MKNFEELTPVEMQELENRLVDSKLSIKNTFLGPAVIAYNKNDYDTANNILTEMNIDGLDIVYDAYVGNVRCNIF